MKDRLRAIFKDNTRTPEPTAKAVSHEIFSPNDSHRGAERKKFRENANKVLGIARKQGVLPKFPRA